MIKKVFLQATICLLLAACSNDPNPLVTGYGDVRFLLSVDPSVTPVAGAAGINVDAPSADALALSAINCRTATVKSWASLAKFESGSQKLPVGEYIFSASYGDKDQEGFIAPTFFAEQPNCVKEDEETFHRINIFREMQFDKKQGGLSIRFNEKSEQQHSLVIQTAVKPLASAMGI